MSCCLGLAELAVRASRRGGSGELDGDLAKEVGMVGADSACLKVAGLVVSVLLLPPFPYVVGFLFGT